MPLETLRDGRRAVAVEIGDDHVRAVLRQLLADGLAEAAAAARHERGASGKRLAGGIVSRVHMHLLYASEESSESWP
jgi:hypothetical protein